MTNKKSTKRALIASVISLLLCFTMLMGTTYAWFTDSVTSANNIITTGNLDVELYHTDKAATKEKVTSTTELFDDVELWEPGAVVYETLEVVNEGTLALKYQLSVNVANATATTDGKTLADVLKVGVIDGGATITDRDALIGEVKDWSSLASFTKYGKLDLSDDNNKSDTYTVVIYWEPSENDNDYNMNNGKTDTDGKKSLQIEIGVNLFATQLESESDSFGKDYDANATYGTYVELEEDEEILDVLANAKAGEPITIVLNSDVEWVTDAHHGENNVTPASAITIDGNGYTITAKGAGVTPIGDLEAPMTLKNVTIVDKSASYAESAWELSYLEVGGKDLVCENVTFKDPIMVDSAVATFTNCSFVGYYDTVNDIKMNGVWMYNGDATFTSCTFTGTRGMKICDMYAGGEIGTVVIDNCTFNSLTQKPGIAIDDEDTQDMKITIKNSTFINCQPGDQGLYIYETDNTVPTLENNTVINGAISSGRIEYTGSRYQIAADFSATGVKTLAVKVLDEAGNLITTITPETYPIPEDGKIGNATVCAAVTGDSSSWQNTAFVPSLDVVPTTMVLVVNGIELSKTGVSQTSYPNGVTWDKVVEESITTVTGNAELTSAIGAGYKTIYLENGTDYDLKGIQSNGLTLIGKGDAVEIANTTDFASNGHLGAIWKAVNLENVTITNTVYTMAEGGASTFTNVTFAAGFRQGYGSNVTFNNCTFGSNSEKYALHFQTDSASEGGVITLTGCEFGGGNVHLGGKRTYVFTDCDFVEGTDFQVWSGITLDGCTVNGVEVTADNIATLFPNLDLAKVTIK